MAECDIYVICRLSCFMWRWFSLTSLFYYCYCRLICCSFTWWWFNIIPLLLYLNVLFMLNADNKSCFMWWLFNFKSLWSYHYCCLMWCLCCIQIIRVVLRDDGLNSHHFGLTTIVTQGPIIVNIPNGSTNYPYTTSSSAFVRLILRFGNTNTGNKSGKYTKLCYHIIVYFLRLSKC